jgi:hypothetical protein
MMHKTYFNGDEGNKNVSKERYIFEEKYNKVTWI